MNDADDMKLPKGMTCRNCAYFLKCVAIFGCKATNTECDWAPSRFTEKMIFESCRWAELSREW